MKSKSIEKNAANVIFTTQFKSAHQMTSTGKSFTKFVDYTDRDEAVELDLKREAVKNKKYKDFGGFVEYMDRDSATSVDARGRKLTSNFNGFSDHLTKNEVQELKDNLIKAQKNNSNIYSNVVSFSTKFLKENGIYDDKSNSLNQNALREIIRESMGSYIDSTPLKNPMWWGDIHVNTNHVHVHIGMAEIKPSTPEVSVGNHKEHRGKLPEYSFNVFKHQVINRTLAFSKNKIKEQSFSLKKDIAVQRQKAIENIGEKDLLKSLMLSLPDDRNFWKASSNAKEMQPAKKIIKQMISSFENENPSYQKWLAQTKKLLEIETKNYGKNSGLLSRKLDMDRRLANRILKTCRDASEDELRISIDNLSCDFSDEAIEANQLVIKNINAKLKDENESKDNQDQLKKELSIRKVGLKKQFSNKKIASLKKRINSVEKIKVEGLSDLQKHRFNQQKQYVITELEEKIEFNKLRQQKPWELTKSQKEKLSVLNNKYVDPVNIQIDLVTDAMVKLNLIRNNQIGGLNKMGPSKTKAYKDLTKIYPEITNKVSKQGLSILETKLKIKNNKKVGKDNLSNYKKLKSLLSNADNNKNIKGDLGLKGLKQPKQNIKVFKDSKDKLNTIGKSLVKIVDSLTKDLDSNIQKLGNRERRNKKLQNQMLDAQRREDQENERER